MGLPDSAAGSDAASASGRASRAVLLIVFVTILIDFVGFSVLIPVLPLYAERLGAAPHQIGFILTVYALSQLLFLPAWGWVSDRIGRRPVILVSLLGTALSFVVLAGAETIGGIYLARALAGFFAASIGTAQAVVTDVTSAEERARGMGVIGAAFGVGMILGPVMGGVLAAVDERAPFYAVAILASAADSLLVFYPVGTLIAFGNAVAFPSFTSLFSRACADDQAGELLAQSQSMATAGRIVGPVAGGFAMERVYLESPFVIASLMMFTALVLFRLSRRTLLDGL
jgi:multidrug resistance protein